MAGAQQDFVRTAAAMLLLSLPSHEQMAKAIKAIRSADAADHRVDTEKIRDENAKLRVENEVLRRLLNLAAGPDAIVQALDIIEYEDEAL
jgi:regulator of replication initiation timing